MPCAHGLPSNLPPKPASGAASRLAIRFRTQEETIAGGRKGDNLGPRQALFASGSQAVWRCSAAAGRQAAWQPDRATRQPAIQPDQRTAQLPCQAGGQPSCLRRQIRGHEAKMQIACQSTCQLAKHCMPKLTASLTLAAGRWRARGERASKEGGWAARQHRG